MARLKTTKTKKPQAPGQPADAWAPQFAIADTSAPPPKLPPSPGFLLTFHPLRWTVQHGRVLPMFGRLTLRPGVGRVRNHGGRFDITDARAELQRRGWTVIPHDAQGAGTSYLRQPEGTAAHVLQWVKTYSGSAQTGVDAVGYVAFVDHLVATAAIQPVALHVLERMHANLSSNLSDAADKAASVPSARSLVSTYEAKLAIVQAAIDAQQAELVPVKSTSTTPQIEG